MHYNKFLILFFSLFFSLFNLNAQDKNDAATIKNIFDEILTNDACYENLRYLTTQIGGRLSGSPQAAAAVDWTKEVMENYGFDTVFLQEVMVPHWVRGKKEIGRIVGSKKMGSLDVAVCALGNSVGTGDKGVSANLVEVQDFEELKKLGKENIQGKVVFFNRPMDPTLIQTFQAYGGAVNQRGAGASEAAKYGAIGAIVRSMTTSSDDFPHTGSLNYTLNVPQIPAIAISTKDADLLSKLLKDDKELKFYFETHCEMKEEKLSYNVVGQITGIEFPEEYIAIGGHLDSWDLAQGAHDDGTGCMQSIEVLRVLKTLGIKPKRSIRAVMFMNEENGLRGGLKYAELAKKNKEKHIAALESDSGGFTPKGFSIGGSDKVVEKVSAWSELFKPYKIHEFEAGGGGADIGPLKAQDVPLFSFRPDSQRYFDYHHASNDTFDKVNKRELDLGAAAMTSLIYLIDKYGLQ
ncbi:M20/M25/M40 family metallo-hydrolase [Chondrinema litorale]|uniref:M20/M25/M40 family metallo-hydrolase n=1 Tax=Chondrinema litorale TaxID=2994555 RepID=UPI00254363E5|nr:M20/M25/M40 family metallo-hydrolase [Chondrinema litorale]UZR95827.1 M20/M25/M40 family metallo-hydrolase [Chondrinema litorale]